MQPSTSTSNRTRAAASARCSRQRQCSRDHTSIPTNTGGNSSRRPIHVLDTGDCCCGAFSLLCGVLALATTSSGVFFQGVARTLCSGCPQTAAALPTLAVQTRALKNRFVKRFNNVEESFVTDTRQSVHAQFYHFLFCSCGRAAGRAIHMIRSRRLLTHSFSRMEETCFCCWFWRNEEQTRLIRDFKSIAADGCIKSERF